MKVLIAIRGYYPSVKHGGPPISIQNLCEATGEDIKYYIITTNHDKGDSHVLDGILPGWNQVGKAQVQYLPDALEKGKEFDRLVLEVTPDLIYLQSLFDFNYTFHLLRIAKKRKIPCLLAVRGELSDGVFKKKYKKIPYIFLLKRMGLLKNVTFHATYDDEKKFIQSQFHNGSKVRVIKNLPAVANFKVKTRIKRPGQLKAVFISRIVKNKNLLDLLKSLKFVNSNVSLDVFGFLQDPEYWRTCEAEMKSLPPNVSVQYCGELRHEDVIKTLGLYDVMILPTYSENFGQIIAESLLASCPVIISDRTPWNDIAHAKAGYIAPLHDLDALSTAIETVAQMDQAAYDALLLQLQLYTKQKLDVKKTAAQYVGLFTDVAGKA